MFEQAKVAMWGANEDRHLVEPHTCPCFSKHPARHFNAFAPLTRRGKELDGSIELTHWRLALGVEEESADACQVAHGIRWPCFHNHSAHRREMLHRVTIPLRHGREHHRGAGRERLDELSLRSVVQ
jgi:hypothetical protein